jgi:hypothetical protein
MNITEEAFKIGRKAHLVHQNWYRIWFTFLEEVFCYDYALFFPNENLYIEN